ncbi:MAG: response regulator transcription factor [Sulfurimonas sp.]|uniref:response regulator transcription factor n=1 Tax=Sulfurimonas sp. TaxID=2022749 RepID=UPI00263417A9|nr:response regulator transcription factor [Sulfurimonas sp.]MDD5373140.1 response regulator transcription factor [Sulfurimonas sp.]
MNIIIYSADINIIDEWKKKEPLSGAAFCGDADSLLVLLKKEPYSVVIADYDSVAPELNGLFASGTVIENLIVLEKAPEAITGKSLIFHGIKAYGNSRMLSHHISQMLKTVQNGNIWSYPELTALLAKTKNKKNLSIEAEQLLKNRLSQKEQEIVHFILEGLTNDAIAQMLNITPRTVKAHITSIFSKLHVNDRLSLVLLVK